MRTLSICALALMGCSLTSKLNLPSLGTSSNHTESTPRVARTSPTPTYAPSNGPTATPVVQAGPAPASYAWCSKVKSGRELLDRALTDDDPDRAIPAIVEYLCHPDGDAKAKRNELEARRQYWMQRLAMNEADWAADVPAWAAVPYSTRNTAYVPPEDNLAWSAAGPVEQFALLSMKTGASSAFALQAGGKTYIADALALTQAGRVAFIDQCIHTNWDNEEHPAAWAMCQPDIDALDAGKFAAELRADTTPPPYDRMVVRIAWANLGPKLTAHAAKVKKLLGDEDNAKLFEIARSMHAEWKPASYPTLALVRSLDDARAKHSKKSPSGCSEKAWVALSAEIAKIPAKQLAGANPFDSLLTTPNGYLAVNAIVACEGDASLVGKVFDKLLDKTPGYRGPRTATLTKFSADEDQGSSLPLAMHSDYKNPGSGSGNGVVASVADQGDAVRVEFKKTSEMQTQCTERVRTNRIQRIDERGNVYYEDKCTKNETKKVDTTDKPVMVAKRHAAGIVPGVEIDVADGVAVMVMKPGSAAPTHVLGIAVKP